MDRSRPPFDWKNQLSNSADHLTIWAFSSPPGKWTTWALAFTLWALYTLGIMVPDTITTNMMAHDNYIFIDGTYRTMVGDVPHIDFVSGLGPLNFLGPGILGAATDDPYTAFLMFNMALLSFFLAVGAYLSLSRLPRIAIACLLFYLAALIGAPVPMGLDGNNITYAMYYNRIGWGLLILLALLNLPSRSTRRITPRIEGILTGLVLVMALYLKVTFFLVGLGIVFYLLTSSNCSLSFFLRALAVLIMSIFTLELIYPGIHLNYFQQVWEMSRAASDQWWNVFPYLKVNWVYILPPFFCLAAITLRSGRDEVFKLHHSVIYLFVLLSGSLLIIATNWETFSLPLMLCGVLACSVMLSQTLQKEGIKGSWSRVMALLLVLSLVPWMSETIERQGALERFFRFGLTKSYTMKVPDQMKAMLIFGGILGGLDKAEIDGTIRINLDEMRDIIKKPPARQEIYQAQYAFTIARGVELLESVFREYGSGSIYNMDFSNPFTHLLRAPTAKGTYLWHHDNRNFSPKHHRPPETVFANVKYVMSPRYPVTELCNAMLQDFYGQYIDMNYSRILSTPYWDVLMKKQPLPQGSAPDPQKEG